MHTVDEITDGFFDGSREDEMIDPITIHIPEGVRLTAVLDLLYFVDSDSIEHPVEFYISRRGQK